MINTKDKKDIDNNEKFDWFLSRCTLLKRAVATTLVSFFNSSINFDISR